MTGSPDLRKIHGVDWTSRIVTDIHLITRMIFSAPDSTRWSTVLVL